MPRHRSETALAVLTLIAAAMHFTAEIWFHFTWGQPLQAPIVVALVLVWALTPAWWQSAALKAPASTSSAARARS